MRFAFIASLILLAFLGLLHQRLFTEGGWWDWSQIHHETVVVGLLGVAVGLAVGAMIVRRR